MIFAANGGGGGRGSTDGAIPTTVQTSRYKDSGYRVAIPAGKCLLYRATHLGAKNLPLTEILDVLPSCPGSSYRSSSP